MKCPLPQDTLRSAINNNINILEYQRIYREFGVDNKISWHVDDGISDGLGRAYSSKGLLGSGAYDSSMLFNEEIRNLLKYISYKASFRTFSAKFQQDFPDYFWNQFTLDVSSGFTKEGILRFDSSMKTYFYCILEAQAQTKSRILEHTTGLETQQQFISLVEDCINTVVDIPADVVTYQKALDQVGSQLDFVFGINLCMAPSNVTKYSQTNRWIQQRNSSSNR